RPTVASLPYTPLFRSTPGAAALLPEGYETEPPEYLAQTVLEMCTLPAAERTGLVGFSLHFPWSQGISVKSLDGKDELPRREPPRSEEHTSELQSRENL